MTRNNRILPGIGWTILALVLLRMVLSCTTDGQQTLFARPEVAAFLQTQKEAEPTEPPVTTQTPKPEETVPPPSAPPMPTEPAVDRCCFEPSDVAFTKINYGANRKPDLEALLTQPLTWDLTGDGPTVLVFHTHGTEAFTPTKDRTYEEEGGEYRTTDADCNMLSLGQELVRLLNEAGIHAVQDRSLYDAADYLASYDTARTGLQTLLKKYPTLKLVIDLHRDSAQREDGSQWATDCLINGEKSAQIMLVVGTDSYYHHPNWEQNLGIALKFHAMMERTHPGSTRPLDLRKQRFNQDLAVGTFIAEIGAAGNTHREAMNAVSVLAEAIIRLAQGTTK